MNIIRKLTAFLLCISLSCILIAQPNDSSIENSANRIINKAFENKECNSPYSLQSFKYALYSHFYANTTTPPDSSLSLSVIPLDASPIFLQEDSTQTIEEEASAQQHLFALKSVSEKYFKKPDKEYEKIIAYETFGTEDPTIAFLYTLVQPESIYKNDFLYLLKKAYLNPISKNATRNYLFTLKDIQYDQQDTLFVIEFSPLKQRPFTALKGNLTITSNGYAVKEISFMPVDTNALICPIITQYYEKQENGVWFVTEQNTQMPIPLIAIGGAHILAVSTLRTSDIQMDIPLRNRDFGIGMVEADVVPSDSGAHHLARYTDDSLLLQKPLILSDTFRAKNKIDRALFFLKTLSYGSLSFGPIDVELLSLIDYNKHEGLQFGAGIYTNRRLIDFFSIGGHFAYGLRSKEWTWGGRAEFMINRNRDHFIQIDYFSDMIESGKIPQFDRKRTLFEGEFYRRWLIDKFDRSHGASLHWQMKANRFLTLSLENTYSHNTTSFNYNFQQPLHPYTDDLLYRYTDYSLTVGIRLAFKERQYKAGDFIFYENSDLPVISLLYTRGIKGVMGSQFAYNRQDIKINWKKKYRTLGSTEITLMAGYIPENLPYSLLYAPKAGYSSFGFSGKEQFGSMLPNEFLSNAYINLFIWHNFGPMTQNKKFSPKIIISQNIGVGWLFFPEAHHGVTFKTMEHGYFETGLLIEDLLVIMKIISFGPGVYYRYGKYAFPNQIDNFAFKLRFRIAIG